MEGRRPRPRPAQDQGAALIRLQKLLAEGGIASRRAAETLITGGHVAVNGRVIRELGSRADPALDTVTVDGQRIRPRRKFYIALHKPRDFVCSRRDEHRRRTVLDLLPAEWSGLYPVGRLDRDSEGLLLLTNDGDFCLRLTHPRFGVPKCYRATVAGRVNPELLSPLTAGILDAGERLRARRCRILRSGQVHSLVEVELTEGKNREVRRLFEAIGLRVERLQRTRVGSLKLGELPVGKWRSLTSTEIAGLLAATPPATDPRAARTPKRPSSS